MTTVTVPAEPRPVPALVVDPEGIRGCGADLRAASAQIDDLGTFVAGGARIGDWTGLGATSYHDAIGPTGRRADAMSLALRAVARRVDAHADEMTRLRTGRADLVDARARAHRSDRLAPGGDRGGDRGGRRAPAAGVRRPGSGG